MNQQREINLHDVNFLRDILKYHLEKMYNTCLNVDCIVRIRAEGNDVEITIPGYEDLLEQVLKYTPERRMENIKRALYDLGLDMFNDHQEDAADFLGVTPRTLRFHRRRGEVNGQ